MFQSDYLNKAYKQINEDVNYDHLSELENNDIKIKDIEKIPADFKLIFGVELSRNAKFFEEYELLLSTLKSNYNDANED